MSKSSENQSNNGILSEYYSPGSKVKDFYIPYHPTFALETPMKPSQIPNRFPHRPQCRSLPFQSPEQHHRHMSYFNMSPRHPPPPPDHLERHRHHGFGPASRRDGENYSQRQQHYPRVQATHKPVHHRHPVTPPHHPHPPVTHIKHRSRDVMLPERDPPEKSTHAESRLELKDKPQCKVESRPLEAVPMMEQNKPSGRAFLSGPQRDSAPRQRCDSWSGRDGLALCPVTDQGRRSSFPLSHTHTSTENQPQEGTASHTSNTRDAPPKRRRESGNDCNNVKKPRLNSEHPDNTVKSPSSDVLSPHRRLSGLDRSPKTPENPPRTESLHGKSVKPVHSPSHGPKLHVKQACIKSTNDNVLILTLPSRKSEILTKTPEKSKRDIPTTPPSHKNHVSSNHHTVPNDPKSLPRGTQVRDNKTDLNCNKPVMKPSMGLSSGHKRHRPKKMPVLEDLKDLFTPDPICIIRSGQKTPKVQPDDKAKIVNHGSSSISSQAQTPVSKAIHKEKMPSPSISSNTNVTYPDTIQISLPTVSVTRLALTSEIKKDAAAYKRSCTSGRVRQKEEQQQEEEEEEKQQQPVRDDSLDLDLDMDLDMDLEAQSLQSSDSEDEPLVSLQEIMRKTKPPDTPEKGAFSDPSTPGHDNHKRRHHMPTTYKTANYKNNLDQMLKEITTSKKAKEMETELLTACEEDLLRIAEFEEAELNKEEPLSAEHQEILQRYSLFSNAIREVPPGHEVFHLEKFGRIFNQNTLQLRQCTLNPRETAQKTLLWSSHAQFKLYVNIGLFQEAFECSPCPFQITRFLFKMMCVHSDSMLSVKILQVLTDIAYTAATQILSGSRTFRVWVPSVADITLVLMNMGVPFVSLFPLETLQPPFSEGDLLENVYIKSESPSNKTPSTFPEHNCKNMFKYLDCCLGLCPRAYSDGELLLLLTTLCTVSLETRLILQTSVELEPLLYKLLNNIRHWDDTMPKICLALTDLTDDHHNMCHLVQLLPEHARGKNLRHHLSLSMISKLLDGSCVYKAKAKELQLCDLRLYVWRMRPSSLLPSVLRSSHHSHTEEGEDTVLLDQQAYYLCYSLLTLTNEATNMQFFPPHQKEHLLRLCSELERHVKCHIRESEKCLYRSKVKDLVARIYTKWQRLLQKTRPLNGQLYDYWQPLQGDSGGSQDIEEIESSQEVKEKDGASDEEEDAVEKMEDGAMVEDDDDDDVVVVTQNEETESTLERTSLTSATPEVVDELTEETSRRAEGMDCQDGELDQVRIMTQTV